jgi:biopolymer transport protein ExbB
LHRILLPAAIVWMVLGAAAPRAWSQPDTPAPPTEPVATQAAPVAAEETPAGPQRTFFDILKESGIIGLLILALSLAAMALAAEHLLTIRASALMPPGLADSVRELLRMGNVTQAMQQCKLQPSFLSSVLQAGLSELDAKWSGIEKAMEDMLAEQSARLYRKIEYLSVIGNIAPMLGLLGTVIGMIQAFFKVAETRGTADAADLAGGIYGALVTTAEGLVVAIPTLAAFAIFRNRLDQLVAEVSYTALHVFTPFKRHARRSGPAAGGR